MLFDERQFLWPLFAMSILSLVPVFVFFILAQQQLVEGISTSGLKG
jgi:multiple sugar transport system permease protein